MDGRYVKRRRKRKKNKGKRVLFILILIILSTIVALWYPMTNSLLINITLNAFGAIYGELVKSTPNDRRNKKLTVSSTAIVVIFVVNVAVYYYKDRTAPAESATEIVEQSGIGITENDNKRDSKNSIEKDNENSKEQENKQEKEQSSDSNEKQIDSISDDDRAENESMGGVTLLGPAQIEAENSADENPYIPDIEPEERRSILFISAYFKDWDSDKFEFSRKITDYLKGDILNLMHSEANCDDSILFYDQELRIHLDKADLLNREIKINKTIDAYKNLMKEYEAAYKIAPCSVVSLQLARPYEEIVIIYPRDTSQDCDQIFEYGIMGIHNFRETLSYEEIPNEDDGDILYRIGQIYHYLGDVPYLERSLRIEMYQTAAAYLEIAGEFTAQTHYNDISYFGGMVYHKLGVISGDDNAPYLLMALEKYKIAQIPANSSSVTRTADIYKYEADVYERLAQYVHEHGRLDYLETAHSYKKLAEEARGRIPSLTP